MIDNLRIRIAAAIMDACHGVYLDDAVNAADAVIAQLESDYILVPKSHTLAKAAEEWLKSDD